MAKNSAFASVIQNRGFLNLWINQILVQLSYNSLNFALIIWVFRLTDSNMAVSALLLAIYLPAVLFGLFSGVLVDITDRRKIIMIINLLLSIAVFVLIPLKMSLLAILLITFFINSLVQFYGTAEVSAIPLIVGKNQLVLANAIFSTTLYTSFLLGFGLAGPLISSVGIDFVFGLAGLLIVIAFLSSLVFPSIKGALDVQGKTLILALKKNNYSKFYEVGLKEIGQTLRLIKGKLPVLSAIAILAGVQVVVGIIAVLAPGFLEKTLRIEATDASYIIVMPLGLGIVAGGVFLGRLGNMLIRRTVVSRAILFAGLLFFLEGISPLISPAISHLPRPRPLPFVTQPPLSAVITVGSFLLGIALVSILVPSQTVLQENTPKEDRGKVFAVLGVAMSGLTLIPVLLSGLLADVFGTTPIFIGLGSVIMLLGLFGLRPSWFFRKENLPLHVREFLGLGHWENQN
ncbi:MFS transporter [Candidatus Daviesbacteria bacterium]|nr:MFS transporter [Candidatus Daviesbacteria bacterium]